MTRLSKLFQTTVFKLSLVYLVVFAIGSGAVIGWVAWSVQRLVNQQIGAAIEAEINGLSEQYAQGGIRRLVFIIDRRTRQPGSSLYLVTNFQGLALTGNVAALPPKVLEKPGVTETLYQRHGESTMHRSAMARIFLLPGGFRLMVGRDVRDRETLYKVMGRALISSLLWLIVIGTLGGLFVARRVLRRVDAMNDSAQVIMQGNLEGRLPVSGSNDELDRLAQNLNAMIARIGDLMKGLREVSDNIAHDLKTPLTRLKSRAEQAIRTAKTEDEYKQSLEKVIEESDELIRIFNALLSIARMEADRGEQEMVQFEVAAVAQELAELYEPVADEAGLNLTATIDSKAVMLGSRELIGQAISNLLDNAIKYGMPASSVHNNESITRGSVDLSVRHLGDEIEIKVADTGRGIPEEDRERVLGRFVRLEQSRSLPGSGLGLSLAAAIARLHKGQLVLSDNAPGLCVTLNLPAESPPQAAPEAGT